MTLKIKRIPVNIEPMSVDQISAAVSRPEWTVDDFPSLECPLCDTLCKPVRVNKGGSVRYKTHECWGLNQRGFTIAEDGSLIEK